MSDTIHIKDLPKHFMHLKPDNARFVTKIKFINMVHMVSNAPPKHSPTRECLTYMGKSTLPYYGRLCTPGPKKNKRQFSRNQCNIGTLKYMIGDPNVIVPGNRISVIQKYAEAIRSLHIRNHLNVCTQFKLVNSPITGNIKRGIPRSFHEGPGSTKSVTFSHGIISYQDYLGNTSGKLQKVSYTVYPERGSFNINGVLFKGISDLNRHIREFLIEVYGSDTYYGASDEFLCPSSI